MRRTRKNAILGEVDKAYVSAVREFTKNTIGNPDFFEKTSEEQQQEALSIINKHKTIQMQNVKHKY